jgi:hypothetical protein
VSAVTWHDVAPGVAEIRGPVGQPIARYSWQRANHPYFDALRPLDHSGVLTNHAPHDHRWHHGLWWSWKFVNDVLFWEDHPAYGGARNGLGRSHVTAHEVAEDGDVVVLEQHLAWRVDASGQDLLAERRRIRLAVDPDHDDVWTLDWDQEWTAQTDVHLDTTPWPETSWGGYAGLNYRPARSMASGETVLGDGADDVGALHGRPAAWAAYTGLVDGAETDEPDRPARGGVALLQHPGDARFPAPVYAFSATDGFGFLATAPLMREPLDLAKDETLRIRTRVAVLPTSADADAVRDLHTAYATGVPARS